jgi:hypothetical protein
VADGVDSAIQRLVARNAKADTFAVIASEWLGLQRRRFAPATMEKPGWTFRDLINPYIGNRPIGEIAPLESRGKHETAHRMKQRCGRFSDTPSLLAERFAIQRRTYAAHTFQLSRPIMQRSPNRAELPSSFARCIHTAAYPSPKQR